MKCRDKINITKRQNIFKEFWAIGQYEKRMAYIAGLISSGDKKISRVKTEGKKHKNRMITNHFSLCVDGEKVFYDNFRYKQ